MHLLDLQINFGAAVLEILEKLVWSCFVDLKIVFMALAEDSSANEISHNVVGGGSRNFNFSCDIGDSVWAVHEKKSINERLFFTKTNLYEEVDNVS